MANKKKKKKNIMAQLTPLNAIPSLLRNHLSLWKMAERSLNRLAKMDILKNLRSFGSIILEKLKRKRPFRIWKARLKEGIKLDDMIQAAINYSLYCEQQKTEARYIKYGSTFLGPDKLYEEFIAGISEKLEKL